MWPPNDHGQVCPFGGKYWEVSPFYWLSNQQSLFAALLIDPPLWLWVKHSFCLFLFPNGTLANGNTDNEPPVGSPGRAPPAAPPRRARVGRWRRASGPARGARAPSARSRRGRSLRRLVTGGGLEAPRFGQGRLKPTDVSFPPKKTDFS